MRDDTIIIPVVERCCIRSVEGTQLSRRPLMEEHRSVDMYNHIRTRKDVYNSRSKGEKNLTYAAFTELHAS